MHIIPLDHDFTSHISSSDWPTIPQLYVKGEFVGGCDIVTELYNTGELQEMLDEWDRQRNGTRHVKLLL